MRLERFEDGLANKVLGGDQLQGLGLPQGFQLYGLGHLRVCLSQ